MKPGTKNLITDVPGLRVGNASDAKIKTGSTVLSSDQPFTASVSVQGGAPGTRETDLLAPDKSVAKIDALVLSGGSAFGLDACSGVSDGLRHINRGYKVRNATIPIVPGAIIFDLLSGGDQSWQENPYKDLGRKAFESSSDTFELGTIGAGTGAFTATLKGGLGSASLAVNPEIMVGALVVANPMGSVTTPGERHFWAAPYEIDAEFGGIGPDLNSGLGREFHSKKLAAMQERANTTIAIVATNAPLTKSECQRMAVMAHDGIGRACVPAHAPADGDLVFAISTTDPITPEPNPLLGQIGHAAALCLSRAICRAVYEATPQPGDILPTWKQVNAT